MKKRIVLLFVFFLSGYMIKAQTPKGVWVTIDDKRNVDIAHVKIFNEDGVLFGKVIELLPEAQTRTCEGCPGNKKGESLIGMTLIRNLTKKGKYWTGGKLLDPKSGRYFDCSLWLDDANTLKVRASFGISLLGRTQTWRRLN